MELDQEAFIAAVRGEVKASLGAHAGTVVGDVVEAALHAAVRCLVAGPDDFPAAAGAPDGALLPAEDKPAEAV